MRQITLVLVCLFILVGCAHKRYLEEGDDYLSTGEYEVAVDKYRQALERKPNHKETRDKFNQAKVRFDNWLDGIGIAADLAEKNDELGKAFILYAKLAKHRVTQQNQQKAHYLFQTLRKKHQLNLYINAQTNGLKLDPELFGYINFLKKPLNPSGFDKNIALSLNNINIKITESTELVSVPYISHYETIANPVHQDILRQIEQDRRDLKTLRKDIERSDRKLDQYKSDLKLLRKDLEIVELKLEQTAGGSQKHNQLKQELESLKQKIVSQERLVERSDDKLNGLFLRLKRQEERLDELHLDLKETPELAEEPVYADYEFPMLNTHQNISGTLDTIINGNKSQSEGISLTMIKRSHDAHEVIDLGAKREKLATREELESAILERANKRINKQIQKMHLQYQEHLLAVANTTPDLDSQLSQRIIAGIIADEGLPQTDAMRVTQQLSVEFGKGGSFPINALIARHSN